MTGAAKSMLAGAAAAAATAALAAWRSAATSDATSAAVAGGGTFKARLTGYWPFTATEAERRMEGGVHDRKGKPLHTLEQHLADPQAHPFVSVSGDDAIFPYGQRVSIDAWPGAVFRVVDTGGHFRGADKVYRVTGREPLDVCVASKGTPVKKDAAATIYAGDHFDKPGKEVARGKFQGQVVVGAGSGLDFFGRRRV